jgi:diguanylate cyclase (GGDEF)-like protein
MLRQSLLGGGMENDHIRRLKALHEIGQALTGLLEQDKLLSKIVEAAADIARSEEATLYLLDERNDVLYARAQKTDTSELATLLYLEGSDSVISMVFQSGETANLTGDQIKIATGFLARAMLAVPISVRGERLGVLAVYNWKRSMEFTQDDEYFLSAVAAYAAIGILNARLLEETEHLAMTDPLTGLWNRRAFESALSRELAREKRYGTGLALVMIDVDGFKEYNDTHGHVEGDERLKAFARLVQHSVRNTDIVCRIGGDEFAVLAIQVDGEEAVELAERIRREAADDLKLPPPEKMAISGFTLSLGVAQCDGASDTPETLVRRADEALFQAKKEGGNMVCAGEILVQ